MAPKESLPVIAEIVLDIEEPSDLCMLPDETKFFMVSDKGRIFRLATDGTIQKQKRYKGYDFEGLCYLRDTLWAVDETHRRIVAIQPKTLERIAEKQYNLRGALNEGWESVCADAAWQDLLLFTEKSPVKVFRFQASWDIGSGQKINFPKEISGACMWQGAYWVVSDEDRTIFKLNAETFAVEGQWRIPVLNPEGIFISQQQHIWILSDDMHRLYKFNLPQH